MPRRRAAAVGASASSGERVANPLDLLQLDAVPGRVADHRVEAALGPVVLPALPDAGEGGLPVQKTLAAGDLPRRAPHLAEGGPEGALPERVGGVDAVGAVGQQGKGFLLAQGKDAHQRRFEFTARLLLHARGQPAHPAERVEQSAQLRGRLFDLVEEGCRRFDLADIGVGHLLDALHPAGRVFGGLDGAGRVHLAQALHLLGGVVDAQADERVAAAQVVVEKGERRADGEAVQPERDLGQLDGERVLVDARRCSA